MKSPRVLAGPAKRFACEHRESSAGLLCLAKGITGGYLPRAETFETEEIFSAFWASIKEFKTFFTAILTRANSVGLAPSRARFGMF